MLERAAAMTKIGRLLKPLSEEDQRLLAMDVARAYGAVPGIIREYERDRKAGVFRESSRNKAPGIFPEVTNVVPGSSVSSNPNGNYRQDASEVLRFLNEKTGKTFRAVDTNLRLIESRLKSGASIQDCKSVIARKVREWKTDPKMSEFLRPKTLFAPSNFESYLGQREAE